MRKMTLLCHHPEITINRPDMDEPGAGRKEEENGNRNKRNPVSAPDSAITTGGRSRCPGLLY